MAEAIFLDTPFIFLQNILMQTADFFRGDNPEGLEARNEVIVYQENHFKSWEYFSKLYKFYQLKSPPN